MAEVRLEAVSKSYDATHDAVHDVSLSIEDGEFFVLLGPTGAGKTTTLRLIAGLERADKGRILMAGRDVTDEAISNRDVAFVFQQYSLYPHLTVFENLAFPLRSPIRRISKDEIARRVGDVAAMLRIEGKLANKATALSGGEMQRVAIGRALVRRPAIYLMDEPLSSLDAKLRAELRLELKRIQAELGSTLLYVTHDQIEAMTMADRIGILDRGRLVQVGSPREIYEDPASIYVATRLGSPRINLIPSEALARPLKAGGAHTLGVRTEHLKISRGKKLNGSADLKATVDRVDHLGDQTHLHLHVGDHRLVTLADMGELYKPGETLEIEVESPLLFDERGERIWTGKT